MGTSQGETIDLSGLDVGLSVRWPRVELASLRVPGAAATEAFGVIDAVRIVRHHCLNLPCVLVSGTVGEQLAVEAMRLGANDYVMKGNLTRLVPAVERELRESESRSERRRAERALAASEERMRLIIEHALDAVVSFTAQGQITEWNLRAEELFGRARVEVVGRRFEEVILADEGRGAFTAALAEGFPAGSPFGRKKPALIAAAAPCLAAISATVSVPITSSFARTIRIRTRDGSSRSSQTEIGAAGSMRPSSVR